MSGSSDDDFTLNDEPFVLFDQWLADATRSEPNDPNAMALATVDADGLPNVRMVLLKGVDPRGFVFYTNYREPEGHRAGRPEPKAAVVFHWKSLRRQVRVRRSDRAPVTDAEADEYFASRPRGSRIGAWASQQSRPLESRFALEKAVATVHGEARHRRGAPVRRTGPATASCRRAPWSSGTIVPSACMTGSQFTPSGAPAEPWAQKLRLYP